MLSPELRLLRHPFAVYAELSADNDAHPLRTVLERTFTLLIVIAASVSFITAGRLTWRLLLGTSLAWAMVPVLETMVVFITHALSRTHLTRSRALGLYMAGNGPLLLFLPVCAAVCIFAPDVYRAFSFLLRTFVLPAILLWGLGYGWFLSFVYYRVALGLSRSRSAALLAVDVLLKIGLVVGWYLVMDNIIPQLGWSHP